MIEPMSEKLAALRAQAGLTQEEVARHLGVTKAAVSKWECGQSLPDITLLPIIAEFYAITIDELFNRCEDLDQKEIDAIYNEVLSLLSQDFNVGLMAVQEQARTHWSCASLLRMMSAALISQLGSLEGFEDVPVTGQARQCILECERLLRRIEVLAPQGESSQFDQAMLSKALFLLGKENEAESRAQKHVPVEPNLSALTLSLIQSNTGREEESLVTLQKSLLFSLLEVEAVMAALAVRVSEEDLQMLANLACGLQPDLSYVSVHPTLLPIIRLEQVRRYATEGKVAEALEALTLAADAMDVTCEAMAAPVNPILFSKVTDLLWDSGDEQTEAARKQSTQVLRESYANALANDETIAALKDIPEFAQLLARIGGTTKEAE